MADNERVYVIEGEDYPSVTTILGATVAKQSFLIPWAIKGYHQQASEWIQRNKAWGFHHRIDAVIDALNVDETRDALMEARDKEGYKPARIGNVVHHIISQSIHAAWDGNSKLIESVLAELDSPTTSNMGNELREMFADEGLVLDSGSDHRSVSSCLSAWQQWLKDFGVSANTGQRFNICETEKLVYCKDDSSDPLYAGTVDLMLLDTKQPNRRFIIDIKTGTLNDEVMYQVAAYSNAFEYMALERWKDDDTQYTTDPVQVLARQENHIANSNSERWMFSTADFWETEETPPEAMVDYPGVDRCFALQLQRTAGKYVLKEAKDWRTLYRSGFKKAQEWFKSQKGHSLGRQIKPNDFLGERIEATIKEG
jgi:hypothetical protein